MGFLDRILRREQKSYSSPELLLAYYGKTPQFAKWDTELAIKEGYKHSTWVYACINLRASSASSVPWIVERQTPDGWELDETSPLARLLVRPNPDMDLRTLIEYTVQHQDLSGNAYWSKVRAGNNQVGAIWILMPDAMRVVPGMNRLVDKYEYSLGPVRKDIPPEDIIHFRYPDPGNLWFGVSPLKSAAQAVDIDNEAERFQKVSLENRGMSDVHFEVPADATAEQVARLREIYSQQQTGSRNARKALFSSAKVTMMNTTAAELDFTESRRFIRDEICSAFGVPPPMVGNYDKATLANIETARQIFWRDTMIPVLDRVSGTLNMQLANEFPGYRIRYDLSQVDALRENFTEKVENAKSLWSMGLPWNEINKRLEIGFEDVAGGDVGYLPSSLLPTDFAQETEEVRSLDNQTIQALAYGEQKQENTPPEGARNEAQKGLDWRKEYGRGGTEVGIARARDIARGANLSNDTIGRMVSYFARHEVDKEAEGFRPGEKGYPSNGRIAWALWGGDAGKSWADKRWAQINKDED
jgi:HK97 family phage portal protein